jgi:hypothetical protein
MNAPISDPQKALVEYLTGLKASTGEVIVSVPGQANKLAFPYVADLMPFGYVYEPFQVAAVAAALGCKVHWVGQPEKAHK